MYKYIFDPLSNKRVSIKSKKGRKVLEKYLNQLSGGSNKIDLTYCKRKQGKRIGSGSLKKVYNVDCLDNSWQNEDDRIKNFNNNPSCNNSVISIVSGDRKGDKERFDNEIKIQNIVNGPTIHSYGQCFDYYQTKYYKIENKLDKDLIRLMEYFDEKENIDIQTDSLILNNYNRPRVIYGTTEKEISNSLENFKAKFLELIKDVNNMHKKGYAHFDIKLENIMVKLDQSGNNIEFMKLIDFGSANLIPFYDKTYTTPSYHDHITYPLNETNDIFSLGITLLLCLFNDSIIFTELYMNEINIDLLSNSFETPIEWVERIHPRTDHWQNQVEKFRRYPIFTHLIYRMLSIGIDKFGKMSGENRISLDSVIKHSFWKIPMDQEAARWENTREYREVQKMVKKRETLNVNAIRNRRINRYHDRNYNLSRYGFSKRGDHCVCLDKCQHQTYMDCIAGLCKYTKKCPVNPEECYGKQFDRC